MTMKPINALAHCLQAFIDGQTIPRSALGTRTRAALQPLFDMQALKELRGGAGWVIHPENPKAIKQFAKGMFPEGLLHDGSPMSRAAAVASQRNAKRGQNITGEPLLLRAFSPAMLHSSAGQLLDVATWTTQCGVAAILLTDDTTWTYPIQKMATVENLEPFLLFEQHFPGYDAALYTAGRMSERQLTWLTQQTFAITHFGDYDPVGLCEFLRIKNRCGARAELYVPDDLPDRLKHYGKPVLMKDSSALLPRLRQSTDPQVQTVLHHLEHAASGLEQEMLWANVHI